MPKRTDLKKIMIIGSGPIVIGQAAEFDYAGTQACLALKEEGYEVVLVNSNPATIMTDTSIADKVYMEPLTLEYVARILRKERPDAIVPGIGGQTGLNLAMQLEKKGILKECQVELLGTSSRTLSYTLFNTSSSLTFSNALAGIIFDALSSAVSPSYAHISSEVSAYLKFLMLIPSSKRYTPPRRTICNFPPLFSSESAYSVISSTAFLILFKGLCSLPLCESSPVGETYTVFCMFPDSFLGHRGS